MFWFLFEIDLILEEMETSFKLKFCFDVDITGKSLDFSDILCLPFSGCN